MTGADVASRLRDAVRDSKIRQDCFSQLQVTTKLISSAAGRDFPRYTAGEQEDWKKTGFHTSYDEIERWFHHYMKKEAPFLGDYRRNTESESIIIRFKRNLPSFDGFWHINDLLSWVDDIEDFFEEIKPPEHLKCRIVWYKMMGAAYYWWKQLQDDRKGHGKEEINSWSTMKKLIISKFATNKCSMKLPKDGSIDVQVNYSITPKCEEPTPLAALTDGLDESLDDDQSTEAVVMTSTTCSTKCNVQSYNSSKAEIAMKNDGNDKSSRADDGLDGEQSTEEVLIGSADCSITAFTESGIDNQNDVDDIEHLADIAEEKKEMAVVKQLEADKFMLTAYSTICPLHQETGMFYPAIDVKQRKELAMVKSLKPVRIMPTTCLRKFLNQLYINGTTAERLSMILIEEFDPGGKWQSKVKMGDGQGSLLDQVTSSPQNSSIDFKNEKHRQFLLAFNGLIEVCELKECLQKFYYAEKCAPCHLGLNAFPSLTPQASMSDITDTVDTESTWVVRMANVSTYMTNMPMLIVLGDLSVAICASKGIQKISNTSVPLMFKACRNLNFDPRGNYNNLFGSEMSIPHLERGVGKPARDMGYEDASMLSGFSGSTLVLINGCSNGQKKIGGRGLTDEFYNSESCITDVPNVTSCVFIHSFMDNLTLGRICEKSLTTFERLLAGSLHESDFTNGEALFMYFDPGGKSQYELNVDNRGRQPEILLFAGVALQCDKRLEAIEFRTSNSSYAVTGNASFQFYSGGVQRLTAMENFGNYHSLNSCILLICTVPLIVVGTELLLTRICRVLDFCLMLRADISPRIVQYRCASQLQFMALYALQPLYLGPFAYVLLSFDPGGSVYLSKSQNYLCPFGVLRKDLINIFDPGRNGDIHKLTICTNMKELIDKSWSILHTHGVTYRSKMYNSVSRLSSITSTLFLTSMATIREQIGVWDNKGVIFSRFLDTFLGYIYCDNCNVVLLHYGKNQSEPFFYIHGRILMRTALISWACSYNHLLLPLDHFGHFIKGGLDILVMHNSVRQEMGSRLFVPVSIDISPSKLQDVEYYDNGTECFLAVSVPRFFITHTYGLLQVVRNRQEGCSLLLHRAYYCVSC